ncbi:MAG: HEPN domain-containing protein [Promethearchaeota archaeon]
MNFNPKKFIDISKELEEGNTEAHYRTIINRAYYGVFGHIKEKLQINNMTQSVHQNVIQNLSNSIHINEKKVGKRLETLFKKRKEADYNYHRTIAKNSCNFALKEAEKIIEIFDNPQEE